MQERRVKNASNRQGSAVITVNRVEESPEVQETAGALDYTPRTLSFAENVKLTFKILGVAGAVFLVVWLLSVLKAR